MQLAASFSGGGHFAMGRLVYHSLVSGGTRPLTDFPAQQHFKLVNCNLNLLQSIAEGFARSYLNQLNLLPLTTYHLWSPLNTAGH